MDKYAVGGCGGLIRRKKGAVGIRINFKGIRMDFISCHLSGNFEETFPKYFSETRVCESNLYSV